VHPVVNGKSDTSQTILCRHCTPTDKLARSLGVSSMDSTFDNFKVVHGTEEAFAATKAISTLQTTWKLLLIYGEWGNGKTHLLEAVAIELWNKGIHTHVDTFPGLMIQLKATFDRRESSDPTFDNIMNLLCTSPYLLLDDIGSGGSFTDWSQHQLEMIMLARYRDNLFTVLTTNQPWESLPFFIQSRFTDAIKSRRVFNSASDYRPKKVSK
jgi:DNA replication protein DnaC